MGFPLAYCSVFSSLVMACVAVTHSLADMGEFLTLSLWLLLYALMSLSSDGSLVVEVASGFSLRITAPIV